MTEKITLKAGTIFGIFHIRDDHDRDGKLETRMLTKNITLVLPTEDEYASLPEFARNLREQGFIVAVSGFECWIINPLLVNPVTSPLLDDDAVSYHIIKPE